MKLIVSIIFLLSLCTNAYAKREIVVCLGNSTIETYSDFLFEILIPSSPEDDYYVLKLEGYGKIRTLVKSKIHKDNITIISKNDHFDFSYKDNQNFFLFSHLKGSSLNNNVTSSFGEDHPLNTLVNTTRLECSVFYR